MMIFLILRMYVVDARALLDVGARENRSLSLSLSFYLSLSLSLTHTYHIPDLFNSPDSHTTHTHTHTHTHTYQQSDAEDFKRERVNTGALNRSLHEGLECGHGMIQSILQNTNLISFKTQSSPSRKRLILEGYVLRAFTPGVTLSYTANKKIKGGEQFVVRGAAVIMSDLWENQILIECWKPPPDLVSVRLQVECEMGLEQTCHLLNLLRLRDAVLDWRCTMLLET